MDVRPPGAKGREGGVNSELLVVRRGGAIPPELRWLLLLLELERYSSSKANVEE